MQQSSSQSTGTLALNKVSPKCQACAASPADAAVALQACFPPACLMSLPPTLLPSFLPACFKFTSFIQGAFRRHKQAFWTASRIPHMAGIQSRTDHYLLINYPGMCRWRAAARLEEP